MNKIKYSICVKEFDSGMFSVYVRCEQFGKSILIDTNVHVFHDEWDGENGLIIRNPNARKLNLFIRKTLYQLEEYELDYDGEFTLSKLKEIWDGRESSNDFYSMMEYQIEHRDIREGTKGIHRRVLKHLRKFCKECSVSDIVQKNIKTIQ